MDFKLAVETTEKLTIDLLPHSSVGWEVRRLLAPFPKGVKLSIFVGMISDRFNITDFQARQVIYVLKTAKLITQTGWYVHI